MGEIYSVDIPADYVMGKLIAIRQLLLGDSGRLAFLDRTQTGETWQTEISKREPKVRWL